MVAHSYEGVVSSEAIQGLDLVTRQKNGQSGGVAHLFLCCSFVISEGKSLISIFGGNSLPWWNISAGRLALGPISPGEIFYNDVSTSEVQGPVARLKSHCQTLHSPVTYAALKHVPTTYLYCLKDNAIPCYVQKMMEETAKGYPIRTETVDAPHSPFFSVPAGLTAAIRRAAGGGLTLVKCLSRGMFGATAHLFVVHNCFTVFARVHWSLSLSYLS